MFVFVILIGPISLVPCWDAMMVDRVPRTRSETKTRHSEFSSTAPGLTPRSHGEENCSSLATPARSSSAMASRLFPRPTRSLPRFS